jgi:hypothetical protein
VQCRFGGADDRFSSSALAGHKNPGPPEWLAARPVEALARRLQAADAVRYDRDIMISRMQISLEREIQRRACQRASDLGVSLAEYIRRLVARDLGGAQPAADPAVAFDLGASEGSDVAANKCAMLAEAFGSGGREPRRRSARRIMPSTRAAKSAEAGSCAGSGPR